MEFGPFGVFLAFFCIFSGNFGIFVENFDLLTFLQVFGPLIHFSGLNFFCKFSEPCRKNNETSQEKANEPILGLSGRLD
jgi:hypothetical protein